MQQIEVFDSIEAMKAHNNDSKDAPEILKARIAASKELATLFASKRSRLVAKN